MQHKLGNPFWERSFGTLILAHAPFASQGGPCQQDFSSHVVCWGACSLKCRAEFCVKGLDLDVFIVLGPYVQVYG